MSNDPQAAAEWAEKEASYGEPVQSDSDFVCPNTGTSQCNDGTGCTRC